MEAATWLVSVYGKMGFYWSDKVAYVLSACFISGMAINVLRRISEDLILRQHRFRCHDIRSFCRCWLICILWIAFVILVVGASGSNRSRTFESLYALNSNYKWEGMDIMLVSFLAFIYGAVVNFIDDAFSVTVSLLRR
jgi:hypothetical protein